MNKFDAVIFDLDGTLCNTFEDLCLSLDAACEQFGFEPKSREHHLENINTGAYEFVRSALPDDVSEQKLKEVFSWYRAYYDTHFLDHTTVFEGMKELVINLRKKGIKTGVLTNKVHSCTLMVIEKFFGFELFDGILGNTDEFPSKPDTPMTYEVMKRMGVTANMKTAMVGDSDVDYHTAKNAALTAIAVTWGYRSKEYLAALSPDFMADSVNELHDILL
ncbi:MAG: HAD family hydrolase [Clostridia bacterium]|nr:HAD family hydrolase [Clostridia bacterium]